MLRIRAEIHFVMSIRDIERLGQFPGTGAKPAFIHHASASSHDLDSARRLNRANQNKSVNLAFDEHVQHPVRAVTEINVGRARFVSLDEGARART